MVKRGYFSHQTPEGRDPGMRIKAAGYKARAWAENLLAGSRSMLSAQGAVDTWMQSPGHRANILSPKVKEVGLSIVLGDPGQGLGDAATFAMEFGKRK
jgi:uncharacterized protein YkwD